MSEEILKLREEAIIRYQHMKATDEFFYCYGDSRIQTEYGWAECLVQDINGLEGYRTTYKLNGKRIAYKKLFALLTNHNQRE